MAKQTNSRFLVRHYAESILRDGRMPTASEISGLIFEAEGIKASPNLVSSELQAFWADMGPKLQMKFSLPGIPQAVQEKFIESWHLANEFASSNHSSKADALKLVLDEQTLIKENLQKQLQEQIELSSSLEMKIIQEQEKYERELKNISESYQNRVISLETRLSELNSLIQEKTLINENLSRDLELLRADRLAERTSLLQQIATSEQKRVDESERISKLHQAELQRLFEEQKASSERFDKSYRFLMQQTDDQRQAFVKAEAKLKDDLFAMQQRYDSLKVDHSKDYDSKMKLIGRAEEIEKELERTRKALEQIKSNQSQSYSDVFAENLENLSELEKNEILSIRNYIAGLLKDAMSQNPSEYSRLVCWAEKLRLFCIENPKQGSMIIESLVDKESAPEDYSFTKNDDEEDE